MSPFEDWYRAAERQRRIDAGEPEALDPFSCRFCRTGSGVLRLKDEGGICRPCFERHPELADALPKLSRW